MTSLRTIVSKTTSPLAAIGHRLEAGDLEALVTLYAHDAEIEFDAPGPRQKLDGPIGLRQGLERIMAAGLRHELRLVAVGHAGSYVVDRCRDPHTGTTLAWGGLTTHDGLIARHTHSRAWNQWQATR